MIHKKPSRKGPVVTVPASDAPAAPATGGGSFARRVRTRRRKAQAVADAPAPRPKPAPASRGGRPAKAPALHTRAERLDAARARPPRTAQAPAAAGAPPADSQPSPAPQPPPTRPPAPRLQRDPDEGFVAVGRIQGPYGLKGELRTLSLTDNPDRFRVGARLHAGRKPVTVIASREAQGYVYLRLKGFPDRSSVEQFRNTILQVPEGDLPALEEGEYYRFQLVGLEVVDAAGLRIGRVAEVLETGSADVYRVARDASPDLLLAATPDVVRSIDLAARRMVVDPPDWI